MRTICVAGVGGAIGIMLAACSMVGPRDASTTAENRTPTSSESAAAAASAPSVPTESAPTASDPADSTRQRSSAPAVAAVPPGTFPDAVAERLAALVGSESDSLPQSEAGFYMDLQEANLRQALQDTGVRLMRGDRRIELTVSGPAAFDTGTTAVSPAMDAALNKIARVLAQYPKTFLSIHGHTDPLGDAEYNRHLSEQRAINVARRLVAGGVEPDRMVVVGHGESDPVSTDTSPGSRPPNRRIEVHLEPIVRPTSDR